MATFSQYLTSTKKDPNPRQITWLCGPEVVLVEEIVSHVVNTLAPDPWNFVNLVAGEDSERTIWSALDQHPLGSSPRVVVIRHAQQLKHWERFISWVKDRGRNPRTYVVMVSDEEHVPKTEVSSAERRDGLKPQPLPHIAAIGSRGHVVECKPFTSATALKSLEWVKSKVPMRDNVAKHLLERANWDLRLVRDTCLKLAVFPGDITISVINSLLEQQPRDTFTDALLALDRKTAFLAAEKIPETDIGRTIGLLDAQLDLAGRVHDMQAAHKTSGEMAKALGPQAFLLPDILKVSRHYSAKRRRDTRRLLAMVDQAYRSGQRIGLLEAVVSLW